MEATLESTILDLIKQEKIILRHQIFKLSIHQGGSFRSNEIDKKLRELISDGKIYETCFFDAFGDQTAIYQIKLSFAKTV